MTDKKFLSGNWEKPSQPIAPENIERANMTVTRQLELLREVEAHGELLDPTPFLDDIFVKGYGSSLFLVAPKAEVLEKFGLEPEGQFIQHIERTSAQGPTEKGILAFTRSPETTHMSQTMATEEINLEYEGEGQRNDVATLRFTEHRLGDLVMTEVGLKEATLAPQNIYDTLITAQQMLVDCRQGPMRYEIDVDEVSHRKPDGPAGTDNE